MPDQVLKQRKTGQGIIVYGWCPAKNKAIALQVDENGRLVIDPEDLDTRYLKLDATNDLVDRLNFPNLILKQINADMLGVRNKADSAYKDLTTNIAYTGSLKGRTVPLYIDSFSDVTGTVILRGRDVGASAFEEVARVQSHATQPYFEIRQGVIPELYMLKYGAAGDQKQLGSDVQGTFFQLPTSLPTGGAGSSWFNPANDRLNIHNGTGWVDVLLT